MDAVHSEDAKVNMTRELRTPERLNHRRVQAFNYYKRAILAKVRAGGNGRD